MLASERHGQALAVAQQIDDPVKQAMSLLWSCQAAWYEGDYLRMIELANRTLTFQNQAPTFAAGAFDLLGVASMRLGRLEEAERFLEDTGCRWLPKPFRLKDLLKAAGEMLG